LLATGIWLLAFF